MSMDWNKIIEALPNNSVITIGSDCSKVEIAVQYNGLQFFRHISLGSLQKEYDYAFECIINDVVKYKSIEESNDPHPPQ